MDSWLTTLIESSGGGAVADQCIPWSPAAWTPVSEVSIEASEAVKRLSSRNRNGIRRDDVRSVASTDEPVITFVAAMIWGFGPHRVTTMLTTSRDPETSPAEAVTALMTTTRTHGAADGFRSLWRDGRSRIHGLGTAFGTKALHFASDKTTPGEQPLVLDQFVHSGARKLVEAGVSAADVPVPDPRKYLRGDDYARYCRWAHAIGVENGITGEAVEYVLFQLGKGTITPPNS